jgi:hypothetical protein
MDGDNQHQAGQPAPAAKDALEHRLSQARLIWAKHNAPVDALMADLRAEAQGAATPSGSNSEPLAGNVFALSPTRTAALKPDLVAQAKRKRTKACVDVLRADLLTFGIEATDDTIFGAWERHSETHSAGWLSLYGNADDNVRALLHHLDLAD